MNNFHSNQIMHVTNVTLRVKDIGKMLTFYLDILKMTLISQKDNTYFLGTSSKNVLVILIEEKEAVRGAKAVGLYHFALLLPTRHDLGVFFNYLLATNFDLGGASDHDVSEALYLQDPEGNGIEIYIDRLAKDWKFNNQQIVMTSQPLNYRTLLKEQGEYTQLPADTKMGHLHLHVNDISVAQRFFVETLGFAKMLDYGPSASFISTGHYHHHIAFNTWLGSNRPALGPHQTGMVAYEINVPSSLKDALIERLKKEKSAYSYTDNVISLYDINQTRVNIVIN